MKKLRLAVDSLTVASFATEEGTVAGGTVQGNLVPTNPWCAANTYQTYCPNTLCTCPPPR